MAQAQAPRALDQNVDARHIYICTLAGGAGVYYSGLDTETSRMAHIYASIRKDVILSGGDPLALSDRQFHWLMQQLAGIEHLITVRIHTRLPIVIPRRVTTELLQCLSESRLRIVMVVHCNHARELDPAVADGFSSLGAIGVTMLNQSVVLKDVNDNSEALTNLNKALFAHNVLPYYLHMPDQVAGTEHFMVSDQHAKALIKTLHATLPGYLVPRLVRENPGERGKTRIA